MILDYENGPLDFPNEIHVKSYCDCCKKTYWSNEADTVEVKDVEIDNSYWKYTVSVCPECISKYDLDLFFSVDVENLIKRRNRINRLT